MDESELEAAERRKLRCVWVTGGRALTEQEAAAEIVSEARLLLQEDLAQLGVRWDPSTLPPQAPSENSTDDHPSGDSDASSASVSPHQSRLDRTKEHQTRKHKGQRKASENHRQVIRRDAQIEKVMVDGKGMLEGEAMKQDVMEPRISEVLGERAEERMETKPVTSGKYGAEHPEEQEKNRGAVQDRETLEKIKKQEEEISKRNKPAGKENHDYLNQATAERCLTQELAEILSSPLPPLPPQPHPPSSPTPTPRFRPPTSRLEQPQTASTSTAKAYFSPSCLQPGRLKHSIALSKVLQSIQTERGLEDRLDPVERPHSNGKSTAAVTHVPIAIPENPNDVSTPTHADGSLSSLSPPSAPLFTPEAKRRRIDAGEVDKFSSPELYAGQDDVQGESFSDSFDLDTQTERIIVQNPLTVVTRGTDQMVEPQRKQEDLVEGAEAEAPEISSPRFNISVTESQMELILNTNNKVSDCIISIGLRKCSYPSNLYFFFPIFFFLLFFIWCVSFLLGF